MAFKATIWVYQVRGITLIERLVLGFLAYRQNSDDGTCVVSAKSLQETCELSRSSVFRALHGLRKKGFISTKGRFSKDWQLASQFVLHLDRTQSLLDTGGSTIDTGGSTIDTPLESGSESVSESFKTAGGPATKIPDLGCSDHEQVKIEYKSSDFAPKEYKFEFKGLPLTPQMVEAGIVSVHYIGSSVTPIVAFNTGKLIANMKVDDILQMHSKKLTPEAAISKALKGKNSYTQLRLAGLWRDLNLIYRPGEFQKPLTTKEGGQLGQVVKLFPDKSAVDVGWILNAVLGDWGHFGKFLKEQGIVQDFPDQPHVGFFLKHAGIAVGFHGKKHQPQVSKGAKPFDPKEFCN